ncbi:MAG: HAD family hydrolase [bacterium]
MQHLSSLREGGTALVFDLWNTLAFDSLPQNPFDATAAALGLDPAVPAERALVEHPLMSRAYRDLDEALDHLEATVGLTVAARDRVRRLWDESARTARLFDDVEPCLAALGQRYPLALLTNTQSFGMEPIVASGLFRHFSAVVLSYEHGLAKPDPTFFAIPARLLGCPAERLVMIGDSIERDLLPARVAGYRATVLLDRGGAASRPAEASAVIHSLGELVAALT